MSSMTICTSQPVFLQTLLVMWTLELSDDVCYLTEYVFFKLWLKILDFILLSYQRGFWKSGLAALDIHIVCQITYTWFSTYNRKLCYKTTTMFPVTTFFPLWISYFYQEIFLMHIVRETASYSCCKGVALGTLVTLQQAL
jgi:hypothetical protein